MLAAGARADVWETTYLHVLNGPDPVLQWISGTGMRPVLAALDASGGATARDEFLKTYAALLRAAYPRDAEDRTIFPFRRIFGVGVV
jgi:trans-aconitate 2-methyltransferase